MQSASSEFRPQWRNLAKHDQNDVKNLRSSLFLLTSNSDMNQILLILN